MFYVWPPEDTVNYGELIEPRVLPDLPLATAGGAPFRLSQLKGKWVLVSIDRATCDAYCELKLVYMRQLRLTQGKNRERVERLWLVVGEEPPRQRVAVVRRIQRDGPDAALDLEVHQLVAHRALSRAMVSRRRIRKEPATPSARLGLVDGLST